MNTHEALTILEPLRDQHISSVLGDFYKQTVEVQKALEHMVEEVDGEELGEFTDLSRSSNEYDHMLIGAWSMHLEEPEHDGQPTMYEEYQDLYGGDDAFEYDQGEEW